MDGWKNKDEWMLDGFCVEFVCFVAAVGFCAYDRVAELHLQDESALCKQTNKQTSFAAAGGFQGD